MTRKFNRNNQGSECILILCVIVLTTRLHNEDFQEEIWEKMFVM